MLKWIRGKRLDLKTSVFLLALAVAAWALVVRANVADFIPEELRGPVPAETARTP